MSFHELFIDKWCWHLYYTMASAHYFFRNYDIKQVINLVCYMTEYPHTLTSTQKITRLYRYRIVYAVVFSAEKNNGLSVKTDAILLTITATLQLPDKNWKHCLISLKIRLSSVKLWSISRSVFVPIWIQLCSSTTQDNTLPQMDVNTFGVIRNFWTIPLVTTLAAWLDIVNQDMASSIILTSLMRAQFGIWIHLRNLTITLRRIPSKNDEI